MLKRAYAAAAAYALIIGLSFLFVKQTLEAAPPFTILAHRFLIAFLVVLLLVICTKQKVFYMKKQHIPFFLGISLVYPVLFFSFQIFGLVFISSSEAGIYLSASPAFAMLLALLLLKERASVRQITGVVLSIGGVLAMMISSIQGALSGNLAGSLLMILCALSMAVYQVLARKLSAEYSPLQITFWMTACGFVVFHVIAFTKLGLAGDFRTYVAPFTSMSFLWSILYLSILSSLASSFLANYTLSRLATVKMSIFNNLATLITVLAGVLYLKEALYWYHIVGAALIVSGILLVNMKRKEVQHEQQEASEKAQVR